MQLIPGKIAVPELAAYQTRPRLVRALGESLEHCSATVIVGRAGTGKTVLAADFARHCGRKVAWFKVNASEAGLKPFVEYLVASVSSVQPGFGVATLAMLGRTGLLGDPSSIAEQFVSELLERNQPLLIVIDDFHQVYDSEWLEPFFARLLPLLPLDTHLIILGRTLPPAPLWRLRSKQAMCVIDEAALAFTPAEATGVFQGYGVDYDQVAALIAHTYGRAGLVDAIARQLSLTTTGPNAFDKPADYRESRRMQSRGPVSGAA